MIIGVVITEHVGDGHGVIEGVPDDEGFIEVDDVGDDDMLGAGVVEDDDVGIGDGEGISDVAGTVGTRAVTHHCLVYGSHEIVCPGLVAPSPIG